MTRLSARPATPKAALLVLIIGMALGSIAWQGASTIRQKHADDARLAETLSTGRQIYLATMAYVQDKEHFPDAATWEKDITPYLPAGFTFSLPGNPPRRFALNPRFSSKKLDFLSTPNASQAALFFESTSPQASPHDPFTSLSAGKNSSQTFFVLVGASGGMYSYPNEYAALLNDPKTRGQITGE